MTEPQTQDLRPARVEGEGAISLLRNPATIRRRCAAITQAVSEGRSGHFSLDRSRLPELARRVEEVTRAAYPTLQIPYHSRWRHFESGGIDRKALMDAQLAGRSADDMLRARVDLTVISVLLDAGAGPQWHYTEAPDGQRFTRSEGLGVASFHAFLRGDFSADPQDPLRVDAARLLRLDGTALNQVFQCTPINPLLGVAGRAELLQRLGQTLQAHAAVQGSPARPSALLDALRKGAAATGEATLQGASVSQMPVPAAPVPAAAVLGRVLDLFSPIWLTGSTLLGVPLGDVWQHRWAGGEDPQSGRHGTTADWVPFHKLSQWMSYSLLEPLEWAGIQVTGLDSLTGLPEYRNGGLFLDGGVIVPRGATSLQRTWKVGDEFIIEWRALTVSLLDELAPLVRARLGQTAEQMPLARVLEGGTWATGRLLAKELRDGSPPLSIESDGTVF